MADSPTVAPVTVHCRWPWTGQEIGSIAVLGLLYPLVLALVLHTAWYWLPLGPLLAVYLCYVAYSRKKKSAITAILTGTFLEVRSSAKVGSSQIDLATVTGIARRKYASDDALVLSAGDARALVPQRLLRASADIREAVAASADEAAEVSTNAWDLLSDL